LKVAPELHVATIDTFDGTLINFGVSLESEIVVPAVTGPLKVTVHRAVESDESVLGVQTSDLIVTASKLTGAPAELPLRLAVTVAVPLIVIVPAIAVKLAEWPPPQH